MMRNFLVVFALGILPAWAVGQSSKDEVMQSLDAKKSDYIQMATKIWNWAELGFLEEKSSALLAGTLEDAGFTVERGQAGMETAFIATYGTSGPTLGLLAEFDALPGVSQTADPTRTPRKDISSGHACGHHLFGTGSVAAAIAIKEWLSNTGTPGTIKLFGTPAEEGGGGKVFMVRDGLFDDVDAVLSWHPANSNSASARSSLAIISVKYRFYGEAAHAAMAPWRGRSAQDAVEAMNHMVNLMREHVTPDTRIHYANTVGAAAPNVVPEFSEVYYILRHPTMPEVRKLFDRVTNIAEAAAKGTETTMDYEIVTGYFNKMVNATLAEVMHKNLTEVGGVVYNDAESLYAQKIMESYPSGDLGPKDAAEIRPFTVVPRGGFASTDVGDISWVTPTTSMSAATWVPGTVAHTWQAIAAGGMSIGHKGMMVAAKTLALSAMDLFSDATLIEAAQAELDDRRGDGFEYEALLGDREPPLEYMKDSK
ncbi:MAG: amidohydrolase [Saprospiraceae bacterium]|nr:amidohydrolase [Saprospiraceae bacterium]